MRVGALSLQSLGMLCVSIAAVLTSYAYEVPAQSNDACGTFYRVQAGDTLRGITLKTYRHDRYRELFRANDDIISNPARIEVGQLIFLPCAGSEIQNRTDALAAAGRTPTDQDQLGTRRAERAAREKTRALQAPSEAQSSDATDQTASLPKPSTSRGLPRNQSLPEANASRSDAPAPSASELTPRASAIDTPPGLPERLVVLSAKGLEPLAGPDLPDGGLIGALVRASIAERNRATAVDLAFVNDRRAHLDVLLPMGQFAMSYPWLAPDCAEELPVGSISEDICGAFLFSAPIFQIEMRIFVRGESPLRDSKRVADWNGKTLCRPGGFVAVDLERRFDLKGIVSETDADACWLHLREGRVDGVSMPAPLVYSAPVPDGFVEIDDLRSYEPIHAVLHKAYPHSESVLELLNGGLRELQQSGAWFELVSAYLSEFNLDKTARTAGNDPTRSQ